MTEEEPHRALMLAAIARDAEAQRALLEGDAITARASFGKAAELYRESWEVAPPRSYGRLIGMLKSAILAGLAEQYSGYVVTAVPDDEVTSAPAAYARALAALVTGDDTAASEWAGAMRAGPPSFERTAAAIDALATRDQAAYTGAISAIVHDFEHRDAHLTGVPIADTALMLERLAAPRGLTGAVTSPLLPATS